MATAQNINADNYATLLKRSNNPRGSFPNGNIYFSESSPFTVQIITAEELATFSYSGGAAEANPLTNDFKIDYLALGFFLADSIASDADLQHFRDAVDPVANRMGVYVGATSLLNGVKLSAAGGSLADERAKISNSGVTEYAATGDGKSVIDRVYHGPKTSGLAPTCQPFYQLVNSLSEADRMAAAPVNFSKVGDVNELIQTFGTTANGDTGAGNFDSRNKILILGVRYFGYSIGEVDSLKANVKELGAYSNPYNLAHAPVLALAGIDAADVWGGAAISPYADITFTRRTVPLTVTGFVGGAGDFTDVIDNPDGASLIQLRAWADLAMQQDTDINENTVNTGVFIPKRVAPLYYINDEGKTVWRVYVDVPIADRQNVIFIDDDLDEQVWPFVSGVVASLSAVWFADPAPYFRLMYKTGAAGQDFETANAVTVKDDAGNDLFGDADDARVTVSGDKYKLSFGYGFDTDTDAGLSAGADKQMVLLVGGTRCKQTVTFFTMTRSASISIIGDCDLESNR